MFSVLLLHRVYFLFLLFFPTRSSKRSTLSSYFQCESLVGIKALKAFALKHTFTPKSHQVTTVFVRVRNIILLYKFSSCSLGFWMYKNVQRACRCQYGVHGEASIPQNVLVWDTHFVSVLYSIQKCVSLS